MSDLFETRMNNMFKAPTDINQTLARKSVINSVAVSEKTFTNDPDYRRGMLYDWDLNEIEMVDFKFQKNKTRSLSNDEVEYHVQFRNGFNPEKLYSDKYYKNDGKERIGFYLDVEDGITGNMDKWMLVAKDDKIYFDRYLAIKCNWMFEWVDKTDGKYYTCLGAVRDASSYTSGIWSDGITVKLDNITSFIVPTNEHVSRIEFGHRFMICDSTRVPKTYKVSKIMDIFPVGVSKFTVSQCYYNEHTDFYGNVKDLNNLPLYVKEDIPDLPEKFGGEHHMICDIIKSKIPISNIEPTEDPTEELTWSLSDIGDKLHVFGQPQLIKAIPSIKTSDECNWNIYIDNILYSVEDLSDYFDITINGNEFSIYAKNKVMAKYIIKIEIVDSIGTQLDSAEMEVIV